MRMRLVALSLLALSLYAADQHVILISLDGFAAYALNDPTLAVPNLRRLAKEGASAGGLQVVNPAVTWPNHTSMVTGVTPLRHGVLYNGMAVRDAAKKVTIAPWRPKTELVRAPTLYDLAQQAGMTTAEIDWVAIHQAPTINFSFSERAQASDPIVKEMLAAKLINDADVADFTKPDITFRDEVWTKAAIYILEKHKPNLLLFHLLTTDTVQHRYAPKNTAMRAALALADARVGELLTAIDRAGLKDKTTVFVASDHGFKAVTKQIRAKFPGAQIIPEGGTAMVYLNSGAKAEDVVKHFTGSEGIADVIDATRFASFGLPDPGKHEGMPELVLAAKDGYAFAGGDKEGIESLSAPVGAHGYIASDPEMRGIFIAWGAGIKPGKLELVRTIDIGPTMAKILGLDMKNVEGRVLTEILQ